MAIHIRWREFIFTLGGAVAWPLMTRGQQAATPVVGFINGRSSEDSARYGAEFPPADAAADPTTTLAASSAGRINRRSGYFA
jgi:hypothetical protein